MIKKFVLIIVVISIIISGFLLFNLYMSSSNDNLEVNSNGETPDEILNEIDVYLLGEDNEVEIGEMI